MFGCRPDVIVAALRQGPGVRLADAGAGRRYFTFRFTKAIGPFGVKGLHEAMPFMNVTPH